MCNSCAKNKSFNKSVRTVGTHSQQHALTSWEFSLFQKAYKKGGSIRGRSEPSHKREIVVSQKMMRESKWFFLSLLIDDKENAGSAPCSQAEEGCRGPEHIQYSLCPSVQQHSRRTVPAITKAPFRYDLSTTSSPPAKRNQNLGMQKQTSLMGPREVHLR